MPKHGFDVACWRQYEPRSVAVQALARCRDNAIPVRPTKLVRTEVFSKDGRRRSEGVVETGKLSNAEESGDILSSAGSTFQLPCTRNGICCFPTVLEQDRQPGVAFGEKQELPVARRLA
jgi:hypothetical protein